MNKKALSERDIITKFVHEALRSAGWDLLSQVREELPIANDRIARGPKGPVRVPRTAKRADLVLFHSSGVALAVIEAKDNNHAVGAGLQQALGYADKLGVPFAYSTNGDAFLECDRGGGGYLERELPLDGFPSPAELWSRYSRDRGIRPVEQAIAAQDWFPSPEEKAPRAYQIKAVNRTVEAIAKGQRRILLVMATGTGKTYVAFQIIWRLWKAGVKKRILFLADRNILVDQARRNDFQPFGEALTKIENRTVDKSRQVYLALYQAVSGTDEARNIYKQFSPGFFDLILVDECHRGSVAADSAWREILEYFSSATQIGLTATPKETEDLSNIDYFGAPLFTYSLREGIEDGYLAPYTVIRVDTDRDLAGYTPDKGTLDRYGHVVPDRTYRRPDFDRALVLDERTKLVARKVTRHLIESGDRFAKTIVFCQDIEHAERMRHALAVENADLCAENDRYVRSITGDGAEDLDDVGGRMALVVVDDEHAFARPSERHGELGEVALHARRLGVVDDLAGVRLPDVDDRQPREMPRRDLRRGEGGALSSLSEGGVHHPPPRGAGVRAALRAPSPAGSSRACDDAAGTGCSSTAAGAAAGSGSGRRFPSRSFSHRVSSNSRATATTGAGSEEGEGGGAGGRGLVPTGCLW